MWWLCIFLIPSGLFFGAFIRREFGAAILTKIVRRTIVKTLNKNGLTTLSGTGRQWYENLQLWTDAPISVIVFRRGKPVGFVGIQKYGRTLQVLQMQGFKEVGGGAPDQLQHLLIDAVENAARALRCNSVAIVMAYHQDYYHAHEGDESWPPERLLALQARMRHVYDEIPRSRGYEEARPWNVKALNRE